MSPLRSRFLTPFLHRPSRRRRNCARSIQTLGLYSLLICTVNMSFKTLNEPGSIGARRPRRPGSFEERFRKAKSSMSLRHFASPFVRFCFPSLGDRLKLSQNKKTVTFSKNGDRHYISWFSWKCSRSK